MMGVRRQLCIYFCVTTVLFFEHIVGIFPEHPTPASLSRVNSVYNGAYVPSVSRQVSYSRVQGGVLRGDSTRSTATPRSYVRYDKPGGVLRGDSTISTAYSRVQGGVLHGDSTRSTATPRSDVPHDKPGGVLRGDSTRSTATPRSDVPHDKPGGVLRGDSTRSTATPRSYVPHDKPGGVLRGDSTRSTATPRSDVPYDKPGGVLREDSTISTATPRSYVPHDKPGGVLRGDSTRSTATPRSYVPDDKPLASTSITRYNGTTTRLETPAPVRITDPVTAGMPLPLLIEHDLEAAVFNPPDSHPYKNKFVTPDRWFVADVGHAYVHGSGFVCNETAEFWFNGRGPPSNAKLLQKVERLDARSIDHPVFNLLEKDTEFFQHFPFQSLPLIAVVKSAIAEMDDVQILVNALPQLKSLMPLLLDLPPDRFVWAEPETVYESKKVLVAGYGFSDRTKGLPGRYASAPQDTCVSIVGEMNQKLTPGFLPADSPERTDIIYLTRGVGNRRSVVNETEILSFLREELDEKLNLVVFESSGDLRKDAEALKHARLVIGPHGGAFVNLMFLPVGLDVVEFNMLGGRPCFIAATQCMGLRHWLVEPENEFEYTLGPVEGTWMTVSVDAVRKALDRIGVLRRRDGGSDVPPDRNLS